MMKRRFGRHSGNLRRGKSEQMSEETKKSATDTREPELRGEGGDGVGALLLRKRKRGKYLPFSLNI